MIEKHYTQGNIYTQIILSLQQSGINTTKLSRKDIAVADEFHIGGQEMTRELARGANLQAGMRVLDIGCGLGGPCRLLADEFGCIATGIDITAEYVDTATKLSQLTGLEQGTNFVQGSATELPFADDSFDIAWTQHVQMNIAEKKKFYAEAARVLAPGGRFVYYDVLSIDHQSIYFPVPWASDASISHLITGAELKEFLLSVGLQPMSRTDETEKSNAFLQKIIDKIHRDGLPALGIHLAMGNNPLEKLQNLLRNLIDKKIVVESGIAEKKINDYTSNTN